MTIAVNVIFAMLVIVMVVAPLVWAIRTSPRDHRRLARARRRQHHAVSPRTARAGAPIRSQA
jgi:uncharacterized membrane-anchored protein